MTGKPRSCGARKPSQSRSGSQGVRNTSAAYKRLRAAILAAEPLCRYCQARAHIAPATQLDHIIALALGGTDDPANLAPSCEPCNSAKAVLEQRYLNRGYDPRFVHVDPELGEWVRIARASQISC